MQTVNTAMIPRATATSAPVVTGGSSLRKSSKPKATKPVEYWNDPTWDPNTYSGPTYDAAINWYNKKKKPYVWNGVTIIDKKGQAAGPLAKYRSAYAQPKTTPAPVVQAQPTPDYSGALFPSARAFEPKSYEGSPLYKWRLDEGNKFLNRKLSEMGLLNSGANIEASQKLATQVSGEEADKARIQSENEADRLAGIQQNEANRLERQSNSQFDRMMSVLNLVFSQSPFNAGQTAAGGLANMTADQGKALANILAQSYAIPQAPYIAPPPPSGPNYSNILPYESLGNTTGNLGYTNLFSNLLAGAFSAFGKK